MTRSDASDESRTAGATLIAVAAGALLGIAVGVLVADRYGGLAGIRRRLRLGGDARATLAERRSMAGETYADAPLDDEDIDFGDDDFDEEFEGAEADLALERRVLAAFEHDVVLRERAVDISALDGSVIELSGWVRSPAERHRAAEVARGVEGVGTVANELFVGDPETGDAADLTTR
jgi:hyperosmotically inducible protein